MKEFLNISSFNKKELTEIISQTNDDTELAAKEMSKYDLLALPVVDVLPHLY